MATAERDGVSDVEAAIEELDLGPSGIWAKVPELRESKFFAEYLNRLVSGRDMHIIVTAASETGVGKTTCAASLAIMMDQQGWTAEKATVASAAQYSYKYDRLNPGSFLILDEAEKAADSRRAMTKESVEVSQAFAAKRYLQIFGVLTAPSKSWVDDRLGSDAADYWIQAQQTDLGRVKGEATVYRLKNNEHYTQEYSERTETIHWPNLDWHPEFQRLDQRKKRILESDEESPYVHRDKAEEMRESAFEEGKQEKEMEVIRRMNRQGYSQGDIGDVVDLHQTTVSKRLNGD